MTDYKATPDQWRKCQSDSLFCSNAACLLELRARVKNIEENLSFTMEAVSSTEESVLELQEKVEILADFADQVISKTCSQPTPNDRQIRSSDHIGDINKMVNSSAGLTSSLVERVQRVIGHTYSDDARAAILEVAAWLREYRHSAAADMLEVMEAKRG